MDEISKDIDQLRRDKAPRVCNITTELLRDTGVSTKVWLHRVISTVWEQESIPQDWKKAIIIPIHKKGDRKECGNSRGISLLSVPGKVLTRVILNRIGKIIDEKLRDNQCGYRPGRAIRFLRCGSLYKKTENLAEISTLASLIFPRHMTLCGEKECGSY